MSGQRKPWHAGTYAQHAETVRAAANNNRDTRCWRCGQTQAEHGRPWQAGHVTDGRINGELRAECERCNTSAGAARGNRMRTQGTTRRW